MSLGKERVGTRMGFILWPWKNSPWLCYFSTWQYLRAHPWSASHLQLSTAIAPQPPSGSATVSTSARCTGRCSEDGLPVKRIQKEISSLGSGLMLYKELMVGYQTGAGSPPKKQPSVVLFWITNKWCNFSSQETLRYLRANTANYSEGRKSSSQTRNYS